MRITSNVVINNMMKHLQKNMSDLDELNQQLASGKKFQKPSQNPIGVAKSMEFDSLIKNNKQYKRNLDETRNWLNASESAVADLGKVLQRARTLAVQGANGTLTANDRENLAVEVDQLQGELLDIANSRLGTRYLFGGQVTGEKPFNEELSPDDPGWYQGDHNPIKREINSGITMTVSVDGKKLFQMAAKSVKSLSENLKGNNPDEINNDIDKIDDALGEYLSTRAEIGAKINRLDLVESRLDNQILNLKGVKSKNEDIDIAETITNLKMEESVYQASLSIGARIIQPTLVDFLK